MTLDVILQLQKKGGKSHTHGGSRVKSGIILVNVTLCTYHSIFLVHLMGDCRNAYGTTVVAD